MFECPTTQRLLPALRALFPPQARVVVACSGGPDSQTLLDMLARARTTLAMDALFAVGIDHGLRPAAQQEIQHAERLAQHHHVAFTRIAVAVSQRGNIMQNARRARYRALRNFAREHAANFIAVGHTADDQLETIVHHLCRGCGLTGASGMRATRGFLVRPLLHLTRAQIVAYLTHHAVTYAVDPTNADRRYVRPRLRASVAPALRTINARAAEHIAQFAERAQQDDAFLYQLAKRRLARTGSQHVHPGLPLRMAAIRAAPRPLAMRMLALWLGQHGVHQVDGGLLEALWQSRHALHRVITRRGFHVVASRDFFWWGEQAHPWHGENIGLPIPGNIDIPGWNGALASSVGPGGLEKLQQSRDKPSVAVAFDADRLHFDLGLRLWRSSDKLRPFGLDGTMKVGDLFTNTKIPQPLRATWPLVTHGESVLWVVGLRRGSDAPVTSETRRVVSLKFQGALPWSAC